MTERAPMSRGYEIGRDEDGLTNNTRELLRLLQAGHSLVDASRAMSVSRARIYQLRDDLVRLGRIEIQNRQIIVIKSIPRES